MENNDSTVPSSTLNQQFLQPISSSNLSRIKIPDPFFERFKQEEHGKQAVTLLSVPLSRPWGVARDGRKLTDGWREFTEAHKLVIGDYVIFKHKGNSLFVVTTLGSSDSQLNYENTELRQIGNQRENLPRPRRTPKQVKKDEAGTTSKGKKRVSIDSHGAGNSSLTIKYTKQYKKPEEPNALYQAVTKSNLDKNSVYIPKNFVNIHGLEDKNLEQMALTTTSGYVWEAFSSLCADGRVQIYGGWIEFCADNNLQIGDCCKFILIEDAEFIVLESAGLSRENKSPLKCCKKEPCSGEGNHTPTKTTTTKTEKGQSSKR